MRTNGHPTDRRFPHCSALGVLRRCKGGGLCVSTTALKEVVGWHKYQTYLPHMQHATNAGPTPQSCEEWLRGE